MKNENRHPNSRQLADLNFKMWWFDKQSTPFIHASVNAAYTYDVIRETEKAIQIRINKPSIFDDGSWKMWIPKSVIIGEW